MQNVTFAAYMSTVGIKPPRSIAVQCSAVQPGQIQKVGVMVLSLSWNSSNTTRIPIRFAAMKQIIGFFAAESEIGSPYT
jgi:hypothetical protein